MMPIEDSLQKARWWTVVKFLPAALFAVWSLAFTWILLAEPSGQKTFSSPAQASRALFLAAQAGDATALLNIFGPEGKEVVFSGDPAEDKNSREQFVGKYRQMNRLVEEPDGTVRLYIGAENWPLPIPLVNRNNAWYFDTGAGQEEILFRRIGRNEIAAIRVLQELVDAQDEYYSQARDDGPRQYAQQFISDDNKQGGLYWKTGIGETESFIGYELAHASIDRRNSPARPFYGYYYRTLTRQGNNAPGGAKNYIIDGKMTGGFALLAYPAKYADSGIMSFVIDQRGTLYQKDLGPDTSKLADGLNQYDPDETWVKVK